MLAHLKMYSPAEFLTKVFNFVNKHFSCLSEALHLTRSSYKINQESWQDNDIDKISLSLYYKITLVHTAVRGEECENRIIFCILPAFCFGDFGICTDPNSY